jgi:hypothetical protein
VSIARPSDVEPADIFKRGRNTFDALCASAAAVIGICAWVYYFHADLVLSHYDAKAHLVVARRVIDSLTPGWQQIGAVWLPLPHLLLLAPVQNDLLYRTGLAGSLMSLACLFITAWATAALVRRVTASTTAAALTVALITLNPNLLYLYTTPMTEPLLLAGMSLLARWQYDWTVSDEDRLPRRLGWLLVALAWTRFEGWAVIAATGLMTLVVLMHRGMPANRIVQRARAFSIWPLAAVAIFLVNSRITVGQWFVSDGFFVPDPTYAGQIGPTVMAILEGTASLGGQALVWVAGAGATAAIWTGGRDKSRNGVWVALAMFACALLPLAAFYQGHPFRIRYMTPLVAAAAVWCGVAVGYLPRRLQGAVAAILLTVTLIDVPPFAADSPMVREAQLDRPAGLARREVSDCLAQDYRGEKVLASMGSLAHYMQELSWHGFALRDFVNEGNGIIWEVALETGPAPHVGWMLVEEVAEGGDVLAQRIRLDPSFTDGMRRACASGGVALYRRVNPRGQ